MTTTVSSSRTRTGPARGRGGGRGLRAALGMLHLAVVTLAVVSLATNGYGVWIDLRKLGAMAVLVEVLWTAATVLAVVCAGPWVAVGKKGPRWICRGYAPAWGSRLLWPTYFVMACLTANTVYYVNLYRQGLADPQVPMPLAALAVLGAWSLLTREWIRRAGGAPAQGAISWKGMLGGSVAGIAVVVLIAGGMAIHRYARPPWKEGRAVPVDLAVVLGGRVEEDGRASVELAQRTLAAVDLYRRGLVREILLSGAIWPAKQGGLPERSEVAAMRQVCLDAGVPDEALSLDPVGVNTRATAFNTRLFMQRRGYRSVVACSTDFHLFRTAMAFRECGLDAYTLPGRPVEWQCADPWSTCRELLAIATYALDPHYREPKAQIMQLASPRVVVTKSSGSLQLFDGGRLVKTYACISGGNSGDKSVEGDRKTPEGQFHIVFKNPQSKFHLSLGLDYPNREDAERGLAAGLINRKQYDDILAALASDLTRQENQQKLWYTPLGGEIFLHGHAEGRTGTAGCVALSNPDIEELYAILPLGTPVEVRP